jgi:hypothetical protein
MIIDAVVAKASVVPSVVEMGSFFLKVFLRLMLTKPQGNRNGPVAL